MRVGFRYLENSLVTQGLDLHSEAPEAEISTQSKSNRDRFLLDTKEDYVHIFAGSFIRAT